MSAMPDRAAARDIACHAHPQIDLCQHLDRVLALSNAR